MRVLVTGWDGFIGTWLCRALRRRGHTVGTPALDLFDASTVDDAVAAKPWDAVVHLAGISKVRDCDREPELAWRTNLSGTALLLDRVAAHCPAAHVVFPSTGYVYAAASGDEIARGLVIDESRAIAPVNRYATTKWAGELLLADRGQREGAPTTVLRVFNHAHKSQAPVSFLAHLYHAMQALDGAGDVPVGNLDVRRDFGALADLLRAFVTVIEAPRSGHAVFNVCSGHGSHLHELAVTLAERLGVDARLVTEPSRVRPDEPPVITGSSARLQAAHDWTPRIHGPADVIEWFLADDPLVGLA